jgi:hypothetical protein
MAIRKINPGETHFLNVDLEIYSSSDLQPLVDALGKKALVLYVGKFERTYQAALEVTKLTRDADSTIREFCRLIEALPRPAKKLWKDAKKRDFNIGFEARHKPHASGFVLSAEAVKQAAAVEAQIVITVYAPPKK